MSHFVVVAAVKADDSSGAIEATEAALAPYDENADIPQYLERLDDETVQGYVRHYKDNADAYVYEGEPVIPPLSEVPDGDVEAFDEWLKHLIGWNESGAENVVRDDEGWGYMTDYNKQGHWDWYQVGGRWRGFFQVRPEQEIRRLRDEGNWLKEADPAVGVVPLAVEGEKVDAVLGNRTWGEDTTDYTGRADVVRKGEVDWERARAKAVEEANESYDKYEIATEGLEVPPTWTEFRTAILVEGGADPKWMEWESRQTTTAEQQELGQELMDVARARWSEDPWVKALRNSQLGGFMEDSHELWCVQPGGGGREEYVRKQEQGVAVPYAVIDLDGQWIARGKMGWFGMSSDEADRDDWVGQVSRFYDNLPDDVWLVAVDCHV